MPRMIPLRETLTVEFKSDTKKYGDADLFEDVVRFVYIKASGSENRWLNFSFNCDTSLVWS